MGKSMETWVTMYVDPLTTITFNGKLPLDDPKNPLLVGGKLNHKRALKRLLLISRMKKGAFMKKL